MKRLLFHVPALSKANRLTTIEEAESYLEDDRSLVGWVEYTDSGDVESISFNPDIDEAELAVSSKRADGPGHAPVIDIDVPARLVASATPGHSHLFIDVETSWEDYKNLLFALARCGIVESGYAQAAVGRGQSFVRYAPHTLRELRIMDIDSHDIEPILRTEDLRTQIVALVDRAFSTGANYVWVEDLRASLDSQVEPDHPTSDEAVCTCPSLDPAEAYQAEFPCELHPSEPVEPEPPTQFVRVPKLWFHETDGVGRGLNPPPGPGWHPLYRRAESVEPEHSTVGPSHCAECRGPCTQMKPESAPAAPQPVELVRRLRDALRWTSVNSSLLDAADAWLAQHEVES